MRRKKKRGSDEYQLAREKSLGGNRAGKRVWSIYIRLRLNSTERSIINSKKKKFKNEICTKKNRERDYEQRVSVREKLLVTEEEREGCEEGTECEERV